MTAQPLMPPELTDLIIDFLHDDHTGLKNCGLVCRQWLPTAQYHFFRTISSIQLDHGKKFLKLLESSPHIGRYVHTLVDLSPKPYGDVAKYLVNLHTLDLSYSMLDRFEELTKMLSHLASLRELRLFHCLFQVENIEMVTAPIDIDTLRITVPSFDVAEFMEWAATANMFQRVQTFSFIGRGGHSNENLGLCSLLSTTATTLRNIDLSTLNSAHVDGSWAYQIPELCSILSQFRPPGRHFRTHTPRNPSHPKTSCGREAKRPIRKIGNHELRKDPAILQSSYLSFDEALFTRALFVRVGGWPSRVSRYLETSRSDHRRTSLCWPRWGYRNL